MTDEERIEAIEETEEVEDVPEEVQAQIKPGRMKKLKTQLHHVVDNMNDKDSARIRAKFLDRWAELSGLERDEHGKYDYSQIDYDNKWVKLEWWMSDITIFMKLSHEKTRAQGIMMLPEDCRETYYQTGPGNDRPYNEVYMGVGQIKRAIKKRR